jgi:hypothetical protein
VVFEVWNIRDRSRPHLLQIDSEVNVDEDIAHADDQFPRNMRFLVFEIVAESCGRLSNDLDLVNDIRLDEFIIMEWPQELPVGVH